MTELLSILYKLRIFTLDELSEALKGKVKSVEALLARYKQQGWIVAIRRNTYCMKDIASGLPVCDKYEIGSHLSPTACISYHTASTELVVSRNCCIVWRVSSCSMRKGSSIISQNTTRLFCTRRQAICWSASKNKPKSQNLSWSCAEPREPKASNG